jgi:NADPH-dependent curcumin reductase CurA
VLVLGATGAVGSIAVQLAKLHGAAHELGADTCVRLGTSDAAAPGILISACPQRNPAPRPNDAA